VRPTCAIGWKLISRKASAWPGEPAHHVGHAVEVVARDGHRGGGAQRQAGGPLRRAHHRRELLAQRVELRLGARRAPPLARAAALRGVDVDAHLGEAALDHEPLEQPRAPAERVAVRHEHRDEVERPRVPQQLDDLLGRAQRDLAVGELQVARVAEDRAQQPHLLLDGLDRLGGDPVGLGVEVAAPAGEVAARHRADRRAAAVPLPAEHLLRHAHPLGEPRPVAREQRPRLGAHRAPRRVEQPAHAAAPRRRPSRPVAHRSPPVPPRGPTATPTAARSPGCSASSRSPS
jgi:hypothetical protein